MNEQQSFSFKKLINDSMSALLKPKEYFASMPVKGGFGEPVIKALIYGTAAGILNLIWSLLHLSLGGGVLGSAIGIMALIWSIIGALIGLFIVAVIVLIISAICSGSTDYEANIRVTAALMVLMPINALFGFLSGFSIFLSVIVSMIINLYGIWMLYHALYGSLKAKPESSKVLSIVLATIIVLFMVIGAVTRSAVKHISNKYSNNIEEISKGFSAGAEKVVKEYGGKEAEKEADKDMKESGETETIAIVLEKPDGNTLDNPTVEDILLATGTLDKDNDHMILSRGDDFVQTAVTDDGYLLEYKDKTGQYASKRTNFTATEVVGIFNAFNKGEEDWDNMKVAIKWEPVK